MNESIIIDCINNAKPGIEKYRQIQKLFHLTDVSKDIEFQTKFNHFYRIRQRNKSWYSNYYRLMEDFKREKSVDFKGIFINLFNKNGIMDASFSSKMLATLDANRPVWDKFVLQSLDIKPPSYSNKNRKELIIKNYDKICDWYSQYVQTEDGKKVILIFDNLIENAAEFTKVKKIDFVLWQNRSNQKNINPFQSSSGNT